MYVYFSLSKITSRKYFIKKDFFINIFGGSLYQITYLNYIKLVETLILDHLGFLNAANSFDKLSCLEAFTSTCSSWEMTEIFFVILTH